MKYVKNLFSSLFLFGMCSTHVLAIENINPGDFLNKATMRDISAVESSKLALQNATIPEVKEYAQIMIDEHVTANKGLINLARSKNISLTDETDLTRKIRAFAGKQIDDNAFDISYVKLQVSSHQRMVALFRTAIKSEDPAISEFAKNALPEIMYQLYRSQHLLDEITAKKISEM